jgi:adenylate cyclase
MTVAKPTMAVALSLAVLALGLVALIRGPSEFSVPLMQFQADLWTRLGASELTRPGWAGTAATCYLIVTGGAVIFLMAKTRLYWAGLFVLGALVIGFYTSLLAARMFGLSLDVTVPGLSLVLVFAAGGLLRQIQIQAFKRELRFAFADSLPRIAIEKIVRDPSLLPSEGETRNISYLVLGVHGLTDLMARFQDDPKAFTRFLETILTPLMRQALAHGGMIDRFTADGFTAYWNAPLTDSDHAAHACAAADGMVQALARINREMEAGRRMDRKPIPAVEIGMGIATGSAVTGGFGGHGRPNYTINGEVVRQATRLQAMSRNYGPTVIVAAETKERAAGAFAFLEVDYIAQSREDRPIRLYAMMENSVARASPKIRALVTFHEHILQSLRAQQWGKAKTLIAQCRRLSGACQTLYDLYLARIRYFESNPPGPNWDGAFRPILK